MAKYKVIECDKEEVPIPRRMDVNLLINKYGLGPHYTPEEVYLKWLHFSEDYCASWLFDNPESIEEVFNVKLERIE